MLAITSFWVARRKHLKTFTSRRLPQSLFQSGQAGSEGPLLFFGLFSLVLDAQTVSLPKCFDGRVQDVNFALLLGRRNVREKCKPCAHVYDVTVQVCFSLLQFVKLLVDAKQLQFGFSHTGQEAITIFVALIFLNHFRNIFFGTETKTEWTLSSL
jgi:hypothetical protein